MTLHPAVSFHLVLEAIFDTSQKAQQRVES